MKNIVVAVVMLAVAVEEKLEGLKKSLAGDLGAGTEYGKQEGAGAPK
jgi:hypothetical protein